MRILLLCLIAIWFGGVASAERIALLVGNAGYGQEVGELDNPHNDIAAIRSALLDAGFAPQNIKVVKDTSRIELLREVTRFAERAETLTSNDIAFFYYSGHGARRPLGNGMSLIPTDVRTVDNEDFWFETIDLNSEIIQTFVGPKGNRSPAAWVVAIDACRNELRLPQRALGGGSKSFGGVPTTSGMLISFAADTGETAADKVAGSTRLSPYAKVLSEELVKPGRSLSGIFNSVRPGVMQLTGRAQQPVITSKLNTDPVLIGATTARPGPDPESSMFLAAQTCADYRAYKNRYPNGKFKTPADSMLTTLRCTVNPSELPPSIESKTDSAQQRLKIDSVRPTVKATSLSLQWRKFLADEGFARVGGLVTQHDGSIWLLGTIIDARRGNQISLIQLAPDGNVLKEKVLDYVSWRASTSALAVDSDNNLWILGSILISDTCLECSLSYGSIVIQVDQNGNTLFEHRFDDHPQYKFSDISVLNDGSLFLAGYALSGDENQFIDAVTAFLDPKSGKVVVREIPGERNEVVFDSHQLSNGEFLLAGSSSPAKWVSGDIWIVKTDEEGTPLFERRLGENKSDRATSITESPNGGFWVTGYVDVGYPDNGKAWLGRYDAAGNLLIDKKFGDQFHANGEGILPDASGGAWVMARRGDNNESLYPRVWIFRVDENGDIESEVTFEFESGIELSAMVPSTDGGVWVAGHGRTTSSGSDRGSVFVAKLAATD